MNSIAVFCASGTGNTPDFMDMAQHVGEVIAEKGLRVVYGGSKIGLMGAVANGALGKSGKVVGVLPGFMSHKEIAHDNLTDLIMVESMHERKLRMHELSDGVITLPGGFGTMEEMFEMLTWEQLGLHLKPIGILNYNGYYDFLLSMFDRMLREGLLRQEYHQMILVSDNVEDLIDKMEGYTPPDPIVKISQSRT